jgi:hypothetical protein
MKKIGFILVFILYCILFLCGCSEEGEVERGLTGRCEDFIGEWKQLEGTGGFGIGDTLKFNGENNCKNSTFELFWSNRGTIHHQGKWERTINISTGEYIIILKLGEKQTIYYFHFHNNYKTLRLKEEDSSDFVIYHKQSTSECKKMPKNHHCLFPS